MDDAQLIRRYVVEGSEAAFAELVGRHMTLVHSAAMRQVNGNFHHARDVTQMVFTLLARKAASLTGHTALTGWLYATTYFVAGNVMRGERRRRIRDEETCQMNETFAQAESELNWDQLRPVLDRTLFELNERDREAILWRFFDALPLAVVAEKMGINASGAKKRVDRALDKMRVSLAKRGATSTTAALGLMLESHAMVAAPAGLTEAVTAGALASAAQTGTQTSRLLKYLGKAKSVVGVPGAIWVGGILSISAIGVATYELWAAWRANSAVARESADYEAQLQGLRALKRTVRSASPASAGAVRPHAAIRDPKADFKEFLSAYPQARTALMSQAKVDAAMAYGSFFLSAGLTPSQIAQFESAWAQNWIDQMTITPRKLAMPGAQIPPESQMRAILGDAAYQQLQDYGPTVYAHFWVSRLAVRFTGAPPTADQLDQLAQILESNNPLPNPIYSLDLSSSALAAIDWETVIAQAKAVFSAAQWKAVEPTFLTVRANGAFAAAQKPPGSAASP